MPMAQPRKSKKTIEKIDAPAKRKASLRAPVRSTNKNQGSVVIPPAETYRMVEDLVASGMKQQDAFAKVGADTGRTKSTVQGVHFHYRKSIGAAPRVSQAKTASIRASRESRTPLAQEAKGVFASLVDEISRLEAELADARRKADLYDRMMELGGK
jgi:hypothetical protein